MKEFAKQILKSKGLDAPEILNEGIWLVEGVAMYGLALEGGGAKGAYHMGVIKAFLECGYKFGGITGTSIGALNAALIAQGDFEIGYKLWENLDPTQLFECR